MFLSMCKKEIEIETYWAGKTQDQQLLNLVNYVFTQNFP